MYLLGVIIFWVGVLQCLFFKGMITAALINPTAIAMQLFALTAVLTATKGFKVFWEGLQAAASPQFAISEDMRGRAASLLRLLSKTAGLASLIGLAVGLMAALYHMNNTELLSHALASSLTAPFWGLLLIAAVFEPAVFILKKRPDTERAAKSKG